MKVKNKGGVAVESHTRRPPARVITEDKGTTQTARDPDIGSQTAVIRGRVLKELGKSSASISCFAAIIHHRGIGRGRATRKTHPAAECIRASSAEISKPGTARARPICKVYPLLYDRAFDSGEVSKDRMSSGRVTREHSGAARRTGDS